MDSARVAAGRVTAQRVRRGVGQVERREHAAAVGVRQRAHAQVAVGRERGELGDERAVVVEALLGPVAAQPALELREVLGVLAHARERHLMGAKRPLDRDAVDLARAGPALRRAQHDRRPARRARRVRAAGRARRAGSRGSRACAASSAAAKSRCTLRGIVAGDDARGVAVAAQQREQVLLAARGRARSGRRSCAR